MLLFIVAGVVPAGNHTAATPSTAKWHAIHLLSYETDAHLEGLASQIPTIANMGINVLILEVNYSFAFKSHPELRHGTQPISQEGARTFAQVCKNNGVRLIPEFQSLGHQSWKGETFPLLKTYP